MPLDKQNFNYSIPLSAPLLSADNGVIVGDTTASQTIYNGKILYSLNSTTYIPVGISTVVANSVAYQPTAPINPSVGQLWVDSSSSNTSFDPNIIRRKTITATSGQTVFTADLAFTDGYEQVFVNGALIVKNTDYTTTNSITITLVKPAANNDIVEILSVTNLNSVSGSTATTTTNTFTGAQTFTPSNAAITPITINGAFNQTADLLDVKNYSGTNLLNINASGNITTSGYISTGNDNNILGLYANATNASSGVGIIAWGKNVATWGGDIHYLADSRGASGMHRFWTWDGTNFNLRAMIDASGNFKFNASNTGIVFNNSSATTNSTLNDYEAGTFTPTDASGASLTLTTADGYYVKIGRLVHVNWRVQWPLTSSVLTALIRGFPFSAGTSPVGAQYVGATSITNYGNSNILSMFSHENSTSLAFRNYSNGSLTNANMSGIFLYGSATYYAAF